MASIPCLQHGALNKKKFNTKGNFIKITHNIQKKKLNSGCPLQFRTIQVHFVMMVSLGRAKGLEGENKQPQA